MRASPTRPSPRKIFPFNNNESEEKKIKNLLTTAILRPHKQGSER